MTDPTLIARIQEAQRRENEAYGVGCGLADEIQELILAYGHKCFRAGTANDGSRFAAMHPEHANKHEDEARVILAEINEKLRRFVLVAREEMNARRDRLELESALEFLSLVEKYGNEEEG